jgi:DNA-binding transcriptional regulator YhcF (GntR family)
MPPLYKNAKQRLIHLLRAGKYPVGEFLPEIHELAKVLDCKVDTLRRSLGELGREGVLRGVPRVGTKVIRRPARARVAVMLPSDKRLDAAAFHHICASLIQKEFDLEIIAWNPDPDVLFDWSQRVVKGLRAPDTLVLLEQAAYVEPRTLGLFKHIVYANVGVAAKNPQWFEVVSPAREEAHVLASCLLENGFRNAAIRMDDRVVSEDGKTDDPMGTAFCAAMAHGGGTAIPISAQDDPDSFVGLAGQKRIDVFVELTAAVALQSLQKLMYNGIRVPDDLSIVGRYDSKYSGLGVPPIASLSYDLDAIAGAIGEAVEDAVDGKAPRRRIVKPGVSPRGSLRVACS